MPSGENSRARVIVLCGLPGVGKTTVGRLIADRIDGRLLRTDVIRKELVEEPAYTDDETERVYRTVFERATESVAAGTPAILDGTFRDEPLRERAAAAAHEADAPVQFVKVTCEESVAVERIRNRSDDESDAEVEDYDHFRDIFDPLTREHVSIDNSGSVEEAREQVEKLFSS